MSVNKIRFFRFQSMILLLTIIACAVWSNIVFSQDENTYHSDGQEQITNKNFFKAKDAYEILLKQHPDDPEYNYFYGLCILNLHTDRSKALPYLIKASEGMPKEPNVFKALALANRISLQFDAAVVAYKKYNELTKGKFQEFVDRNIEVAEMAKELIKYPINVTIENLGDTVNSPYPDYYPFVNEDGTEVIFTSRKKVRNSKLDIDGYYPSNIYGLTIEDEQPVKLEYLSHVNSSFDERVVGFSKNGKMIFVYVDHDKYFGDLYYTQRGKSGNFVAIEPMSELINSHYVESSGSMSIDGGTYFFASNRPGGFGGFDLYMVRKLPNGSWSVPQNLGDKINTPYNEEYPNLSFNNSTLYFCSEGHLNMGGYDLFKSEWSSENNEWSTPHNLGYPINTPDDNKMISFIKGEHIAYISMYKDEGFGDYDIYRVTFNDKSTEMTLMKISLELDKKKIISEATLDVTNSETGDLYGTYAVSQKSGNYNIILPPGEYEFFIEAEGYKPIMKNYSILSGVDFKEFIQDTLPLSKNN